MARRKEKLVCTLCLNTYDTPESLSCGHSFCGTCCQAVRSAAQQPFHCPLCRALQDPMELQPNVRLQNIVQRLLNVSAHQEKEEQCEEKGESLERDDEVIVCDYCLQEPQPAVKTCLSCEASLCQAHMSKHSEKNPLKDHVLVEPCSAQFLAKRRCPQHGKLLECYCETDSVSICVLCSVTSSHRNHTILSFEEAFGKLQSILPETLQIVKKCEAVLDNNIANLMKQEEGVKTEETLRRNRLESLFEDMCAQLECRKREALKILSHSKKQQLSKIQAEVQKQKERKDAASRDIQELEALRDQKDVLLFIKASAPILTRKNVQVPEVYGVELPEPPIMCDELTTQATLRLFQQFLSDMESLFKAPPVHEHLTCRTSKLVYPRRPQVQPRVNYFGQDLYFRQDVYNVIQHELSDQTFSEGCHFWDVNTNNGTSWKLGTAHRNSRCFLERSGEKVSVHVDQICFIKQVFETDLRVVRVELDCGRNTVTFYNVPQGKPDEPLRLIGRVSVPSDYPARAAFIVHQGHLTLM